MILIPIKDISPITLYLLLNHENLSFHSNTYQKWTDVISPSTLLSSLAGGRRCFIAVVSGLLNKHCIKNTPVEERGFVVSC